jgi:hypothetical protein
VLAAGRREERVLDWENHVDRLIREAMKTGAFDNLPGAGKPLNLDDELTPEHL